MATFIKAESAAVDAVLTQLQQRLGDMSPVLLAIGEDRVERAKQRFASATAPDGTPWAANSQVTIMAYLNRYSGSFSKKTGKITNKGMQRASGKKPLQGESGDLARQIIATLESPNSLVYGSTMVYAAMQHYGGKKAQFPNLWGDIPARPFMDVMPNGSLYPQEESMIVDRLRQYLDFQPGTP